MAVTLFTARVVLDKLGADDFGLYNVVGGVVGVLGFLTMTLSTSTSRFVTYEMGAGDQRRLRDTFSTAFLTHLALAVFVVLFLETAGLWFFYHKLLIPAGRVSAAAWVYHISVLTAFVGITQAPYTAVIMSRERMDIYAYVSIFEALGRLLVVYMLVIASCDHLVLYAALLAVLQIVVAMIYRIYCVRHYAESRLQRVFDGGVFRRMLSFSGWNVLAHLAEVLRAQGVIVLINMFFMPAVVAAQAIGNQVANAMAQFVTNIRLAINPQIIKLYAGGDNEGSKRLTLRSTEYLFDLLLLLGLPLILLMEPVLCLWLKDVPPYTVAFARFIVAGQVLGCFSAAFYIPMMAAGRVKTNSMFSMVTVFVQFPLLYVLLRCGCGVMWVQYVALLAVLFWSFFAKPFILWREIDYKVSEMVSCYVACLRVLALSCAVALPVYMWASRSLAGYALVFFASVGAVLAASAVCMRSADRGKVVRMVWVRMRRLPK